MCTFSVSSTSPEPYYMYGVWLFQKVQQTYEKWSLDSTTLKVCFDDYASPLIELDQQEQEIGAWTILPLAPPPQVLVCLIVI